jgi:hypothetical protein
MLVTGSGWPKYFLSSITPLSFLSVFMYRGTHTDRKGMLAPERNISGELSSSNMTDSETAQDGGAFYVQRRATS